MKFCAIGVGRMGRRHLQVAKKIGFSISGVYDPSDEAVRLAIAEEGIHSECVFNSVKSMLETITPQALVVSSTAPSHCEYVTQAAKAGVRYILCEKPMAVSIEECDQMITICNSYGVTLAINHQMQFMEQYTKVKELANTPNMGGLRNVIVAGSNFGLAMNAAHYFEMFRYITGEEIEVVNFWADENKLPNPRGNQYEDRSGQLRAISKSGFRLLMDFSGDLGNGIQVIYGCKYGQILVDELAGFMRYNFRDAEFRNLPTTRYGMPSSYETLLISPADVISPTKAVWEAMLSNQPYPDGAAGIHAVRALVAANLSAEASGSAVALAQKEANNRSFPWA